MQDGIVTRWLFVRYLVVGTYVGLATIGGYVWWFTSYPGGPQMTWGQLTSFQSCTEGAEPYSCKACSCPSLAFNNCNDAAKITAAEVKKGFRGSKDDWSKPCTRVKSWASY
jgi:hypothetical protein